jgi:hypothetical protein
MESTGNPKMPASVITAVVNVINKLLVEHFRGSVRVWDFKNKQIVRTVKLPGSIGTIDVKLIPSDHLARAYTPGMLDDHLYLVDTQHGTAKAVFDFTSIQAGGWPQLMRVTRDGRRLFVSMNQAEGLRCSTFPIQSGRAC